MKYFRKHTETANAAQWYSLHLQSNLFGGFDVICRWGRVDSPRRREQVEPFSSQQEAICRLDTLSAERIRRGFVLVAPLKLAA